MDLEMPYLDGFETFRQIRNIVPSMESAVVACSGYTSDREKIRCAQIGMDHYLEKPVNNNELIAIVLKYL